MATSEHHSIHVHLGDDAHVSFVKIDGRMIRCRHLTLELDAAEKGRPLVVLEVAPSELIVTGDDVNLEVAEEVRPDYRSDGRRGRPGTAQ